LLGIAFVGEAHPENERIVGSLGKVAILGRLPHLDPLTPQTLAAAFARAFERESFSSPAARSASSRRLP
jgi:dethiobiotin synthetase